jgi:hypothetical protein
MGLARSVKRISSVQAAVEDDPELQADRTSQWRHIYTHATNCLRLAESQLFSAATQTVLDFISRH